MTVGDRLSIESAARAALKSVPRYGDEFAEIGAKLDAIIELLQEAQAKRPTAAKRSSATARRAAFRGAKGAK